MKKNKKAFSLLEVIIASAILSITVFGVYKLIGENSKLINNSDNYLQMNNLFINTKECIKNLQKRSDPDFFTKSTGDIIEINFGNDLKGCESGSSNNIIIDYIEYEIEAKITTIETNYVDLEIKIEGEGVAVEKKDFRLFK